MNQIETSFVRCLALARAALEEALLVLGELAAVESSVLVGDLQLRLLLAQLWTRGAAVSPGSEVAIKPGMSGLSSLRSPGQHLLQFVTFVETDTPLGCFLALVEVFSSGSLAHYQHIFTLVATQNILN